MQTIPASCNTVFCLFFSHHNVGGQRVINVGDDCSLRRSPCSISSWVPTIRSRQRRPTGSSLWPIPAPLPWPPVCSPLCPTGNVSSTRSRTWPPVCRAACTTVHNKRSEFELGGSRGCPNMLKNTSQQRKGIVLCVTYSNVKVHRTILTWVCDLSSVNVIE